MEKLKKNLPIILGTMSTTLLLVAVIILINNNGRFSFKNNINPVENNEKVDAKVKNEIEEKKENNVEKQPEIKNTETKISDTQKSRVNEVKETEIKVNTDVTNDVNENKEENINVEKDIDEDVNSSILSYFNQENIKFNKTSKVDSDLTSKLKTSFVSMIDFIFYDKEIKGHTFKELAASTKLKVISIALIIDNKIDSYFPNYKDKIKDKYSSTKETLAEKYVEFTNDLCEKVGNDVCDKAKEDYNTMKEKFGIAVDFIKDKAIELKDKVKDIYENWRDK